MMSKRTTTPPKLETLSLQAFPALKIGHEQDETAKTGCTVILCTNQAGATGGVDVRGGAPGTRESDLLRPENTIEKIHGIILSGGSAFGLDAAGGVMQFLEEQGIGFDVGVTKVPIVPQAVLFDLTYGDWRIRPNQAMAYRACVKAFKAVPWEDGSIGAGTGATVGKIRGMEYAMKGGLGSACFKIGSLYVGALVAVNAVGDIVQPSTGKILAGALADDHQTFLNTEEYILKTNYQKPVTFSRENTTIGLIMTNGRLTKAEANKLATMTHDAYARTIRPVHTLHDGDTIFTMATNEVDTNLDFLGVLAVRAMEQAILNSVNAITK
ncbi:MAG: P1 family peptidase [Sporomusaceae bacterium]|nr:P1 family peptidase [Sporomusaceae bacterium]